MVSWQLNMSSRAVLRIGQGSKIREKNEISESGTFSKTAYNEIIHPKMSYVQLQLKLPPKIMINLDIYYLT